jgi:hypothetical protein
MMSIIAIKEGDILRIISSSEVIPENTPLHLHLRALDVWQAAQLETVFRDGEDWGNSLDHLREVEKEVEKVSGYTFTITPSC